MRGIVFFVYLCVMKHFLLTIFLAVAAATQAQVTAEKAFTVAPDEVMLLLGPVIAPQSGAMVNGAAGWLRWADPLCGWVITLTTLYSGVEYFAKNKDVIRSA